MPVKKVVAVAALLVWLALPEPASGQAQPAAPWLHPSCQATELPAGECRAFRILLRAEVAPDLHGLADLPATATLDIAEALVENGYPPSVNGGLQGFALDIESFVLIEVDGSLAPVREHLGQPVPEALLAIPGDIASPLPYHPETNPTVTIRYTLHGPTAGPRHYFLYFDSATSSPAKPIRAADAEIGQAATSVGPGRGNVHYVLLHGDLGLPSANDPRTVTVTNLQARPVQVKVHPYNAFGIPDEQPEATLTVPAGVGASASLSLASDASAFKLVTQGGLVTVEAESRVAATTFPSTTMRLFLPSLDGGFVGKQFAGASKAPTTWTAYCAPAAERDCNVSFDGTTVQVEQGGAHAFPASANAIHNVVSDSNIAVQRVPVQASTDQLGVQVWPALDGPASARQFAGDARSQTQAADRLFVASYQPTDLVTAALLHGPRTTLSDGLNLRGPGIFADGSGQGWGTTWNRDWRLAENPAARPKHVGGPTALESLTGPVTVLNGWAALAGDVSANQPFQSKDGGLTYHVALPSDQSGQPLGRIALFAPFQGTSVTAHRHDGLTRQANGLPGDAVLAAFLESPGAWTIRADKPVIAVWHKVGESPMSAIAPGLADAAVTTVAWAQFSGPIASLDSQPFHPVSPGATASIPLTVRNHARTVQGTPLVQQVALDATVPAGWPAPRLIPSTLSLQGGETQSATLEVRVPATVDLTPGGAFIGVSLSAGAFQVALTLRLNYDLKRGVDLQADGVDTTAHKTVAPGTPASYEILVTNTGSVADSFDVTHSLPIGDWRLETACPGETDCFLDGLWSTPELGPAQSLRIAATLAPGDLVAPTSMQFTATSRSDPNVADVVRLAASLDIGREVRLRVDQALLTANPGNTANFTITIENAGELDEEIKIHVAQSAPDAWPPAAAVLDGSPLEVLNYTVSIPAGNVATLRLTQEIPNEAAPGELSFLRLRITSQTDKGSAQETELRAFAGRIAGLKLEGPASIALAPGETRQVTYTVTSLSNAEQTIRLQAAIEPASRTLAARLQEASFRIAPGGNRTVTISLESYNHTPPSALLDQRVVLRATTAADQQSLRTSVQVPERLRVSLERTVFEAPARQPTFLQVPVRNEGNVPLTVTVSAAHFASKPVHIPVGEGRSVPVPVEVGERDAALPLKVHGDGRLLLQENAFIRIREPALQASVGDVRPLEGGMASYAVRVTNTANTTAYAVHVLALRGGEPVDAVAMQRLLPGATVQVNLVVPLGADSIRVNSTADPAGVEVRLANALPASQQEAALFPFWLVAAAAFVLAGRRRK